MKAIIFVLFAILTGFSAFAVDQNPNTGTVVFRVDQRDGSVSMVTSEKGIETSEEAQALVADKNFNAVNSNQIRNELDEDAGSSSWYFYYNWAYSYNYSYTPAYNWYGNYYYPYYTYNYSYYTYYYYGYYRRCWW